jgi:hypothetical protein
MMEVICSTKTLVLARATWCYIPEDGIPHSHHNENLKCYNYYLLKKDFDGNINFLTNIYKSANA